MSARYVIGIDLGTTNCALSYAEIPDADSGELAETDVVHFEIPQLVEAGTIEVRPTLPSFYFVAKDGEFKEDRLALPWHESGHNADHFVGAFARDYGAQVPGRLVSSAKSWLCHSGIDRRAKILPLDSDSESDISQLSPVEVSTAYLKHLIQAWNGQEQFADAPIQEQEVFLTVPASFDAVARELTVEAARQAGLNDVVLLEEPLAAFYSWLYTSGDEWRSLLSVGDSVLVCDIGGGTTDFSLIVAKDEDGDLALERVAVGEHILLGGDNMDLALAQVATQKLKAIKKKLKLDPWQSRALWYQCRTAKERLLADPDLEEAPITLLSRGSKLIGKTLKTTLTRAEVENVVLNGFFPAVQPDDRPESNQRSGLRTIGLPYAQDAAITKHMAAFLEDQDSEELHIPTRLLVNGGVFKGKILEQQLLDTLKGWTPEGKSAPTSLTNSHLDLAVATGAAYYGLVRKGRGIRVRGGVARSYYIGIESAMPAVPGFEPPIRGLCVVPFGLEAGNVQEITSREFGLIVGQKAEFRLYSSVSRQDDELGEFIEDDELELTAPLQMTLESENSESGSIVKVRLQSEVSEVGTLDLRCVAVDGGRDWKLSFNIRQLESD